MRRKFTPSNSGEHRAEDVDGVLPPGDFGLPLIGETIDFARDPIGFVHQRRVTHGDVFATDLLLAKTVFLTDVDGNPWVFAGEDDYLQNKWNGATRRLLGAHCTAMLTGKAHSERRRQLMPYFRHSQMADFAPVMAAIAHDHFRKWAADPDPMVVLTQMQALVFEIITRFLFGHDPQIDMPYLSQLFRRWTAGIAALPVNLPFTTFGRALRAKRALLAEIDAIVRRRRQQDQTHQDLLSALMNVRDVDGQLLTQEHIVHELHNQLFAGHDTTVTVMTNLFLQLAQHPLVWRQARQEVVEAMAGPALDLTDLKRLPYLNQVLNESMRHLPPVAGTFRVMLRDGLYKGYRIPKGWTVRLEIAGIHHHDQIWTDPQAFDPDRWCASRAEQRNRLHSFIPFGGGPRICLGANFAMAEMRVMTALLLRDYDWEVVPGQDLSYIMVPFPRPRSGLVIRFRRHSST